MRCGVLILPSSWRIFKNVKENRVFWWFFFQFWQFFAVSTFWGQSKRKRKTVSFMKKMWFFDTLGTPGGASIVERLFLSPSSHCAGDFTKWNHTKQGPPCIKIIMHGKVASINKCLWYGNQHLGKSHALIVIQLLGY